MSDRSNTKPEPQTFADLANQPSGSGVAAEQAAFMEAALNDAGAEATIDAGTADEAAAYIEGLTPTTVGQAESESEAQPS